MTTFNILGDDVPVTQNCERCRLELAHHIVLCDVSGATLVVCPFIGDAPTFPEFERSE